MDTTEPNLLKLDVRITQPTGLQTCDFVLQMVDAG